MSDFRIFKRKIYNKMLQWKQERDGETALLIKGARRVGKLTIAEEFARRMELLHRSMQKRLAPFKGRSFFVHHPAFGYFARLYGLRQQAVELGGRETTPARLAQVIKQARQAKVKVIFVQKQFNPTGGRALADAIRGEVVELDPLAADVEKNLEVVCTALVRGFGR